MPHHHSHNILIGLEGNPCKLIVECRDGVARRDSLVGEFGNDVLLNLDAVKEPVQLKQNKANVRKALC